VTGAPAVHPFRENNTRVFYYDDANLRSEWAKRRSRLLRGSASTSSLVGVVENSLARGDFSVNPVGCAFRPGPLLAGESAEVRAAFVNFLEHRVLATESSRVGRAVSQLIIHKDLYGFWAQPATTSSSEYGAQLRRDGFAKITFNASTNFFHQLKAEVTARLDAAAPPLSPEALSFRTTEPPAPLSFLPEHAKKKRLLRRGASTTTTSETRLRKKKLLRDALEKKRWQLRRRKVPVSYDGRIAALLDDAEGRKLLTEGLLPELAWEYLGLNAALAGFTAFRVTGNEVNHKTYVSSLWHHDRCGRRLAFVLSLSADALVQVATASHRTLYYAYDFQRSRFADAWIRANYPTHNLSGAIGGGFVFDTNAIHRTAKGPRGTPRSAVIFEVNDRAKADDLNTLGRTFPCPSADQYRLDWPLTLVDGRPRFVEMMTTSRRQSTSLRHNNRRNNTVSLEEQDRRRRRRRLSVVR